MVFDPAEITIYGKVVTVLRAVGGRSATPEEPASTA